MTDKYVSLFYRFLRENRIRLTHESNYYLHGLSENKSTPYKTFLKETTWDTPILNAFTWSETKQLNGYWPKMYTFWPLYVSATMP